MSGIVDQTLQPTPEADCHLRHAAGIGAEHKDRRVGARLEGSGLGHPKILTLFS